MLVRCWIVAFCTVLGLECAILYLLPNPELKMNAGDIVVLREQVQVKRKRTCYYYGDIVYATMAS